MTIDNLLTTEPRPRNPGLADVLKRTGLVERTGRGVDLIYRGLLRYGRPQPDYTRSDAHSVVLRLPLVDADLPFVRLILDKELQLGSYLPIDSLIALAALRDQRRLDRKELAAAIQKDEAAAQRTLERLVEQGLVQAHGRTRARTYTLAPTVYSSLGQHAEYTRQAGFESIQQEYMVISYAQQHGQITAGETMDLCGLSRHQATRLLNRLVAENLLQSMGDGRGRYYVAPPAQNARQ